MFKIKYTSRTLGELVFLSLIYFLMYTYLFFFIVIWTVFLDILLFGAIYFGMYFEVHFDIETLDWGAMYILYINLHTVFVNEILYLYQSIIHFSLSQNLYSFYHFFKESANYINLQFEKINPFHKQPSDFFSFLKVLYPIFTVFSSFFAPIYPYIAPIEHYILLPFYNYFMLPIYDYVLYPTYNNIISPIFTYLICNIIQPSYVKISMFFTTMFTYFVNFITYVFINISTILVEIYEIIVEMIMKICAIMVKVYHNIVLLIKYTCKYISNIFFNACLEVIDEMRCLYYRIPKFLKTLAYSAYLLLSILIKWIDSWPRADNLILPFSAWFFYECAWIWKIEDDREYKSLYPLPYHEWREKIRKYLFFPLLTFFVLKFIVNLGVVDTLALPIKMLIFIVVITYHNFPLILICLVTFGVFCGVLLGIDSDYQRFKIWYKEKFRPWFINVFIPWFKRNW